jgi:hypothetical protein
MFGSKGPAFSDWVSAVGRNAGPTRGVLWVRCPSILTWQVQIGSRAKKVVCVYYGWTFTQDETSGVGHHCKKQIGTYTSRSPNEPSTGRDVVEKVALSLGSAKRRGSATLEVGTPPCTMGKTGAPLCRRGSRRKPQRARPPRRRKMMGCDGGAKVQQDRVMESAQWVPFCFAGRGRMGTPLETPQL